MQVPKIGKNRYPCFLACGDPGQTETQEAQCMQMSKESHEPVSRHVLVLRKQWEANVYHDDGGFVRGDQNLSYACRAMHPLASLEVLC